MNYYGGIPDLNYERALDKARKQAFNRSRTRQQQQQARTRVPLTYQTKPRFQPRQGPRGGAR